MAFRARMHMEGRTALKALAVLAALGLLAFVALAILKEGSGPAMIPLAYAWSPTNTPGPPPCDPNPVWDPHILDAAGQIADDRYFSVKFEQNPDGTGKPVSYYVNKAGLLWPFFPPNADQDTEFPGTVNAVVGVDHIFPTPCPVAVSSPSGTSIIIAPPATITLTITWNDDNMMGLPPGFDCPGSQDPTITRTAYVLVCANPPCATPTPTPGGTPCPACSPTPGGSPTPAGSATPAGSPTPVGSATPAGSPTPAVTTTPAGSPTPIPSPTGSPSASPSTSPSPTPFCFMACSAALGASSPDNGDVLSGCPGESFLVDYEIKNVGDCQLTLDYAIGPPNPPPDPPVFTGGLKREFGLLLRRGETLRGDVRVQIADSAQPGTSDLLKLTVTVVGEECDSDIVTIQASTVCNPTPSPTPFSTPVATPSISTTPTSTPGPTPADVCSDTCNYVSLASNEAQCKRLTQPIEPGQKIPFPRLVCADACIEDLSVDYNCHAWAVGVTDRYLEFDPIDTEYGNNDNAISFLEMQAFWEDYPPREGITLYGRDRSLQYITHSAISDGPICRIHGASSKLGAGPRINHYFDQLEGGTYGFIVFP